MAITYKDSGVDVTAGYEAVKLMKQHVKKTFDANVLGDLGSFGGFYSIENEDKSAPILVAGTDGVGTKLKYAILMDKHDTVGIDCVAMCVNDIICQGAKPLFFLDYLAVGKLDPVKVSTIVSGVTEGCLQSKCALIGGETAEMPGFYGEGEYDMAGFAVGIVNRDKVITGKDIKEGNVLVGIASSGVHSNGYSLVRRLFGEDVNALNKYYDDFGKTLGEALLTPTKIYVQSVLQTIAKHKINGIAHITGGGFIENIPRMIPEGLGVKIDVQSYELPAVFKVMWDISKQTKEQIYNTFNMGIGMVMAVDKKDADAVIATLNACGENACVIGEVVKGEGVSL